MGRAAKMESDGNVVHVLAIGDSLTAGEFAPTFSDAHYSQLLQPNSKGYPAHLEDQLNEYGKGHIAYKVHNYGVGGEGTDAMAERLPGILADLEGSGQLPEFVLMMGGTNDLG